MVTEGKDDGKTKAKGFKDLGGHSEPTHDPRGVEQRAVWQAEHIVSRGPAFTR